MKSNEITKDVSVIIVNYNTKQLLKDCLTSIYEKTDSIDFEVIVSDNGSHDGSAEMCRECFPQVRLIENNANLGFGAANNRGLSVATGKYIFYLNSDTVLLNNAIKIFFDYFESHANENLGAIGCNLKDVNGGGYVHSYGEIIPLKKRLGGLFHTLLGISKDTLLYIISGFKKQKIVIERSANFFIGTVPYVTGADLFVRNDEYAKYDERFFLYSEEVDLQLTMHNAGLMSKIINGPEIIHLVGASSKKALYKIFYIASKHDQELFISWCKFYEKHENKPFQIFLLKIVIMLIWLNPLIVKDTYKNIPRLFKKSCPTLS